MYCAKTFSYLYTYYMIEHIHCYFFIIRNYFETTAPCNETIECEHTEFCNVGGTRLGESKGFCKTGNRTIFTKPTWFL